MKKIVSSILLVLFVLFQGSTVYGINEINHGGITYKCIGNNLTVATVNPSLKMLNIPKRLTIDNVEYVVSSIGSGSFSQSNIEVITLPEEGIDIGICAFKGAAKLSIVNNLDKANIEESGSLFSGCCNLREFKLPENLELIGNSMFFGCTALGNITIPKNVVTIDDDSFLGCSNLNRVDLETNSKLTHIGTGSFAGCENLKYFPLPENIDISEYAFFDCKKLSSNCNIPEDVITYDKNLAEKSKQAELFAKKILENEVKSGRSSNDLIDAKDIDRLLYKYTPKSTDPPTVVSEEEFDKITRDGRLVLYRGDIPCSKGGREITIEEINDAFKYGDFYYPFECNGIFCTKYVDHAKSYARDYESNKMIGSVTQFCFTDISPENLKIITHSELNKIRDFYKYSHVKNYLKFMRDWCSIGKYNLETGLINLGVDTMNFSFLARALGYDMIDDEIDEIGGDGCSKDTKTSQYEVFNRGKLTVCSKNIRE